MMKVTISLTIDITIVNSWNSHASALANLGAKSSITKLLTWITDPLSPGILRFDCSHQLGSGSPSEFGQKSFFLAGVVNAITQELCSNTLECVINRLKMAAQNFLSLETSGRSSQDRRETL
ncbi:uncharacterized protein LOC132043253 isoform X2 [Lycium ferocissimum]|uniref:uncharacterized protein LOC132043253 isoform X2 n=1 Tax=Lycium ferocissimum TaxID=112874 RepID=UPI002816370A|nr:uncharacterized protein LOC132043253 isoform X2 [Lycium ferocissimum]XP_059289744.1 uncharacterized protein LOC132043253 isoform X2 [Lycium ferocissimum]